MKALIIYKSMHHQNTYRLVKHLHDKYGYDLINVDEINGSTNFDEYIYIGIASGIYGFEFSKEITELIKKGRIKNKKMFILYTSAMDKDSFSKNIIKEVSKENELIGITPKDFVHLLSLNGLVELIKIDQMKMIWLH